MNARAQASDRGGFSSELFRRFDVRTTDQINQIGIERAGKEDRITAFDFCSDNGFRTGAGELQFSAENSHGDQSAAAHEDHFDVQPVFGKYSGVPSEPDR